MDDSKETLSYKSHKTINYCFHFQGGFCANIEGWQNVPYRVTETWGYIPVELFGIEITAACFFALVIFFISHQGMEFCYISFSYPITMSTLFPARSFFTTDTENENKTMRKKQ